ncbi:CsoS2 family carboxysome shell protein [Thiomicrorhabdus sp. ZW0627]|uniref:carboxysome assembly protein CsoS2 n=1 Tax=Thiomicrorhabdus sp. ZW0627 TaxID=3039774 RepID=UPI00243687FF|nr:CsoS2 family carboxysome shell protein [Thiomicrorhabdus sp. ZW0627]MDG6773489.1 CsoS2 family carboxysome shell protein [Thiomicrorhabdus sp. ZW0627]
MSVNNAQSGRAAAIARRKAQVNGKGAQASAAPAAMRQPAPAPEPVVATAPAPSQPSRPRREVSVATAPSPASAAGRNAAKMKRQQQKNGKNAAEAAKPMPHPKAKAKQKSEEPIVEPRQAKAEKPVARQNRRTVVKPETAVQSNGRLQSKAYRQAQAKGKVGQTAFKSKGGSQSGAKAKLANPDASTREIAKQVRAEKCSRGKVCSPGSSRPTRPPRNTELPQKVGESETLSGQTVSGTQVGQGEKKMTGAETGACQLVSGTEYLGAEEFNKNCDAQPSAKPAKVTQTQTTRGQSVSGTSVGRAEKMTGNETGTCSAVTGTDYLPADQSQMYCGATPTKAKQSGFSVMSQSSQKTGGKITGGDNRKSQSTTIKPKIPAQGKAPQKVMPSQTTKGNTTTGTQVGRQEAVTGGEKGACQSVTGTGYQGAEEVKACGNPVPETATKVTASGTGSGQKVTGDRSGSYYGMTGAEAGDCKAVTGTPYTGSEQFQFCSKDEQIEVQVRQRQGNNPSISGVQPGPMGLTGAQKGACELVTGTHYQGADQTSMVCDTVNAAAPGESDFPMMMGQAQAQVQAAPMSVSEPVMEQGSRITGDGWDRGSKVTGTDGPWAAQRNASVRGATRQSPMGAAQFTPGAMSEVPMSPITGSSGNTETGAKVTLSGGARA